jgi:hypothetical protein
MPVGLATLDFGLISDPHVEASIDVTGQTTILDTSKLDAWVRLVATPEHSVDEVRIEALKIKAGNIIAGQGFTVYGECLNGRTYGTYTIEWVWI